MVRFTCRVVAVGLVLVGGLVVGVTPASAELGDNNNLKWGVDGTDLTPDGTRATRTEIWAMEQIGDRVYVRGRLLRVANGDRDIDQKYLAAFDAGTGEYIASFNSTLDAVVYTLAKLPDGSERLVGSTSCSSGRSTLPVTSRGAPPLLESVSAVPPHQ